MLCKMTRLLGSGWCISPDMLASQPMAIIAIDKCHVHAYVGHFGYLSIANKRYSTGTPLLTDIQVTNLETQTIHFRSLTATL